MYLVRGSGGYGQPVTAVRFSIGLSSQSHPGRTVSRAEGVSQIPLTFRHPSLNKRNVLRRLTLVPTDIIYPQPLITERNMGRSMELLLLPAPIFEHTSRRIIRICPHSASHQSMLLEAICLPRATFMVKRRQFGERSSIYLGRELQSDTTTRYSDSQQP
ncbi:unnamed protein product [Brassica rapa]|uniref:Uncharacterized protein n=1 Tax=Brassica campestris TaxID=3711 RepID=A0A8D9CMU6_BRACM|nr:unnamed protein product [Brassica rapa]